MQVIDKMEKILDAKLKEKNKENSKKRTAVKQKGVPLHQLLVESHTQNISVIIYWSEPWVSVYGAHAGNLGSSLPCVMP